MELDSMNCSTRTFYGSIAILSYMSIGYPAADLSFPEEKRLCLFISR